MDLLYISNVMYDEFKLPIEYVNEKNKLTNTIVDDLELISTKDSSNNSVYLFYFNLKQHLEKTLYQNGVIIPLQIKLS